VAASAAASPLPPEEALMAVKLNRSAFEHAQILIKNLECVLDERAHWHLHRPSAEIENKFIEKFGMAEYAKWHLGEDDEENKDTKARYKFPYGDFKKVHRCAVLSAESRAGQYKYDDIELAVAHLHGMLETLMRKGAPRGAHVPAH
jgi:hypothetical protein